MKINPDSPAFPVSAVSDNDGNFPVGLTIRAEFAKAAMMGLLGNSDLTSTAAEQLAICAVHAADALIARLNRDSK